MHEFLTATFSHEFVEGALHDVIVEASFETIHTKSL